MLVLEGDHGFRVEISLTVTITQHSGGVANPASFVWPDLEEGYMLVDTFGAMTGPRHLNFTSNPPMFNVVDERITFASGADSPFELNRGVHNGATGGSPLTTIGPNTNIRIRPADGLPVGLHEDVLIVEGDGGSLIEVPVSINVTEWSGNFNFSQVRDYIDFGVRDVGYAAFGWTADISRWILTNTDSVTGISGIDGSQFVFASELAGGMSAFEFESVGFRQGTSDATTANPPRGFIPPNNISGQLRIRPRVGLPAGIHTDTLYIRGDRGFETTVELIFEVNMPDADISVNPVNWVFPDEYEGYSFTPGGGPVRGWREFVFRNNTPTNQPAEVFFESGTNAGVFEDGVTSPFRIHRGLTLNTLTNPLGSTAVIGHLNATTETGIRIVPHNDLPVGTHTDVLVIRNNYGMDIRIPLSFTVLPVPIELHPDVVITPGRVHHFTTRQEGTVIPNSNIGWTEFRFFNHSGAPIPGVSARFESGADSSFAFNRAMGNGTGTGLTGGFVTIANSGVAGTTTGANVRVWPRQDLPIGIHRDVLIIENNAGTFRQEIVLYFEVTALNVSLDRNSFTWPTRHLGYNRHHQNGTVLTNVNNETAHNITGSAEFILTNHGDAPLRLPAWADNPYTRGYFDSVVGAGGDTSAAWVVIHRGTNAQSVQNPEATTGGTVTVVQPGMSVSLRFVPLANRPPGDYHDVFRLRDFYGNELGKIELNFTVIEWDLGSGVPDSIEFESRQVGYIINQHGNTSTSVHGTDAYVFNVTNMLADGNLEITPQILNPVFESELLNQGSTSPFVANMGGSTATGVNGRQTIPLDGNRNFWVRPRQGLIPGLHEDYLIFTSTRTPEEMPLLRIPISIYIYEPDVVVRENGAIIDPADGIEFSDRMPGYTLDENNVNDFIRLSFENLGTNPFIGLTVTILQPDLSGPSTAFSVMTGIMPGADESATNVNILPVDGMVNLRVWQRLDLPIGTHEAVLRLGNHYGFEVFVPLIFTVEDFDTEFFDVQFEARLEDFAYETQTAEFTLRNNSTTPAFIYSATLERGNDSSFVLIGVAETLGTIVGDDILRFDVATKADLPAGLHYDYIIIRGNFGFERRVRVEFQVLPVYHNLNFHLQGGTNINADLEEDFDLIQPVRLNQQAKRPVVNPTRIGYYFTGWFTSATGGDLFDFTNEFTRVFVAENGWLNEDDEYEVDVFARWNDSYHNISFNLHGGSGDFPNQTIRDGAYVDLQENDPEAPIGYYFAGWFDAATGGELFDFDAPVVRLNPSDIVIHARWLPLYHDVVFELQGGGGDFPNQTIRDGAYLIGPANPVPPAGYLFRGWYTAPDGGSPFDFSAPIRNNVVIYARWMPITSMMITFDPNGGVISGYTANATRIGEIGETLGQDMPEAPTRATYYFAGWFTDEGAEFTLDTVITGEMTLYARWNELYHNVTFNLHGGTGNFPIQQVRDGQVATAPIATPTAPTGYYFVGWFDVQTGGGEFDFTVPITADTVIHARYTELYHDVTFNLHGGSGDFPMQQARDGQVATAPTTTPTAPTGYYFVGWFNAPTGGAEFDFGTPITADTVIHARYAELYHEVTFNLHGGSGDFPLQTIRDGQVVTAPIATPTAPTGYYFVGWFTAATGGLEFDFETQITADTVIHARYARIEMTITFLLNGGEHEALEENNTITIYHGELLSEPNPAPRRTGYEFLGWFYELQEESGLITRLIRMFNVNSNEMRFDFTTPVVSDLVLNARWEPLYHEVTFNLNSGNGTIPTQSVRDGQLATMPSTEPMAPTGYFFVGWFDAQVGGSEFDFTTPITVNTTIFARWQAWPNMTPPDMPTANVYRTMTFDLQGGEASEAFDMQRIQHGNTANMPTEAPLRAGYTFVGWFDAATSGSEFDFTTPITSNTIIYARWAQLIHEVKFNLNGGTGNFSDQLIQDGQTVIEPETNPTRSGYNFVGWFTAETGGEEFDFTTSITGNTVIYARWIRIYHEVRFNFNGGTLTGYPDGFTLIKVSDNQTVGIMMPADPVRTGYLFIGWFVEDDSLLEDLIIGLDEVLFTEQTLITRDMLVNARWEKIATTDPDPGEPNPEQPEKPGQNPPDDPVISDPEQPENPDPPQPTPPNQPNEPESPDPEVPEKESDRNIALPQTGSNFTNVALIGMTFVSLGAGSVILKKIEKKRD